ncbi:radical SAM protein [bacterium]|nr:radical SAM protein [bacterium]
MERIVFGPVPSRRLGQSLGVNNIPYKVCSYSCLYCQIGRTDNVTSERRAFYPVEKIVGEVGSIIKILQEKKEKIDYITFVPDGEPTLDINIGKEIEELKKFGIKIAVITNASLLWDKDVRADLNKADLVSIKVDAFEANVWGKINRPAENLDYKKVLEGIEIFRREYKGKLLTETLLVKDINDSEEELRKVANFIKGLNPSVAYIGIPTRPPAEDWVSPPCIEIINKAYLIFTEFQLNTELILGIGDVEFGYTGDVEKDILNIISVHPMSSKQVEELLKKAGKTWDVIKNLVTEKKAREIEYRGERYYLRNFTH